MIKTKDIFFLHLPCRTGEDARGGSHAPPFQVETCTVYSCMLVSFFYRVQRVPADGFKCTFLYLDYK